MKDADVAVRLPPSLIADARREAERQGIALDTFIGAAIAEKLHALQTQLYFSKRAARADPRRAIDILERAGVGNPPDEGDERGNP